ncbi:hypothetical protein [Hirschia baltica]|uniref:Flagellar protein FliL n=1 Tax=Hirschia baltica (strain ATCC 49814 / DSM 5838 / IFAM 1418) TaxID=582402 RepID=C6XR49_HIRBI|nr:hypothetical protein [Hirschia baltica]ACT60580.1 conserved hypothetical protein [Hirschia baltica ATCC 49814]
MTFYSARFALIATIVLALASPMAYALAPAAKASSGQIDPTAKKISGSEDYVPFFGIRVSVASGFAVSAVMAVDAGLHIEKSKTRKHVEAIRPRIMDNLRIAVTGYANGPYREGMVPDLDILEGRMQRAVDKQLGKGASQVVLASVIVFNQD